jgi:hypothetical protein
MSSSTRPPIKVPKVTRANVSQSRMVHGLFSLGLQNSQKAGARERGSKKNAQGAGTPGKM